MVRYFCVYYTEPDKSKISKENKKVKIIEFESIGECLRLLVSEYQATFIRYIRNMDYIKCYINDEELKKIEYNNDH